MNDNNGTLLRRLQCELLFVIYLQLDHLKKSTFKGTVRSKLTELIVKGQFTLKNLE